MQPLRQYFKPAGLIVCLLPLLGGCHSGKSRHPDTLRTATGVSPSPTVVPRDGIAPQIPAVILAKPGDGIAGSYRRVRCFCTR